MKLQLAVFLISVLLEGSVAILSQRVGNCLTRFEQSLKEITDDKKYCVNANIQDCCQVRYLLYLLFIHVIHTIIHVVVQHYTTI